MFSKENLKKSVGWICCIIGLVLYTIGYVFLDHTGIASKIVIDIADVLIIGVVVGYLSSVAQWSGVFKKDIQDIVFGEKCIGERKDIEHIWRNVTKQLLKNKFAGIHKELLEAIKNATLPSDETVSYYENYDSHINLQWHNRVKNIVRLEETISFNLIAESDKEINLPVKTWSIISSEKKDITTDEDFNIDFPKIKVDGKIPSEINNEDPIREGDEVIQVSNVKLKGKKNYLVTYTRTKIYDLTADFFIGLKSQYMIKNLTVTFNYPDGIDAIFIERGTSIDFESVKNDKNCIIMLLKGVIFPKQGYIFALSQRTPSPQANNSKNPKKKH